MNRVRSMLAVAAVIMTTVTGGLAYAGAAEAAATGRVRPAGVVVSPQMLTAMQRDLGLGGDEAVRRLAGDLAASRVGQRLAQELGAGLGGVWLDADTGQLVAAVTDPAMAGRVRAAGAQPRLVARSLRQLDVVKTMLDRAAPVAPKSVTSWYVDVVSNNVVVTAHPTGLPGAARFVTASGADPAAVRLVASTQTPVLLYDVRGGDGYLTSVGRCSIGFSVVGGFVTAGHCGPAGAAATHTNQVALGTVQAATFPGQDHAWVQVNSNWLPRPWVRDGYPPDGNIAVVGSAEALVGSYVCRSGSTSGWRCGTIQAKNVTLTYAPQGPVTGLTRTNACAQKGDSGGPFVAGYEAQGVTVAGIDSCAPGVGETYFQPVNPILQAYGLTLVPITASPTITYFACDQGVRKIVCAMANVGGAPPIVIRWYWNGNHVPSWDNRLTIAGGCQPGVYIRVDAVVTGANGVSASRGRTTRCVSIIP